MKKQFKKLTLNKAYLKPHILVWSLTIDEFITKTRTRIIDLKHYNFIKESWQDFEKIKIEECNSLLNFDL